VHGHGHGHGHSHGHLDAGRAADARRLTIALGLILGLMAAEVVAGILANSIALLSDAAHMLTDAGALVLSLIVVRLAARPARGDLTFGLRRTEILSAQANGLTLLVLAGLIVYGAVGRLIDPPGANGGVMVAVALAGVVVNLLAVWQLAGANRQSLNVEGAFQHVATDLAAFVATAIAGAVILASGFVRADGIAALVVAAIMLRSAVGLLRASGRVLLEAAPPGTSVEAVGRAMAEHPGVVDVHDLHVWEVTSGFPSLSAHVLCGRGDDCHAVRRDLERMLAERFEIVHTTLQVDHAQGRTSDVALGEATARRTPVERR
jgi:cobalt-zinc-cadmium efflux system protein